MTRTPTTTVAALVALAWLPPSTGAAAAQETTIEEALEQLQREEEPNYTPALRILRQVDGWGDPAPSTSAEIDMLADRVAEIAADATLPDRVRMEARFALAGAAGTEYEGTPYPRAFDLLVEVYEGGYDAALYTIWRTDSVRGLAYVRELFERSERPPLCRWSYDDASYPPECVTGFHTFHDSPWCQSGEYLFGGIVDEAWERMGGGKRRIGAGYPDIVPEGLPEHVADWHRRCRKRPTLRAGRIAPRR